MQYSGTPIMALEAPSQERLIEAFWSSGLCALQVVNPKVFARPLPAQEGEHNAVHDAASAALRSSTLSRYVALDMTHNVEPETMAAAVALCMVTQAELLVVSEYGHFPMLFRQLLQVNEVADADALIALAGQLLGKDHEERRMNIPLMATLSLPVEGAGGVSLGDADKVMELLRLAFNNAANIKPAPDHIIIHAMASVVMPKPLLEG